jgi:Bifunctional DNA primase/polymerase, N-terminal
METTNKNAPIVSDTTEAPHSQFSVNPIVPAPTECVNLAQNFLDRANAMLERGFSVIPIAPRDKKPVPGLGANSRTQNLDVVAEWANMWPDANAGVCADDNITILESDDAARFRKILSEMGVALPVTLTGGASPNRPHWFYKRTPACGESCVTVPGLFEFRNVNQYVVGPLEFPREDILNFNFVKSGWRLPGNRVEGLLCAVSTTPIPDAFMHGATIPVTVRFFKKTGQQLEAVTAYLWADRLTYHPQRAKSLAATVRSAKPKAASNPPTSSAASSPGGSIPSSPRRGTGLWEPSYRKTRRRRPRQFPRTLTDLSPRGTR